jgi:uncharacterized membrane protein YphA (DoxX/SURF4 family)
MIGFDDICSFWNLFFFSPEPSATIGLVRILFGILLLLNAVLLYSRLPDYFGVNGWYPLWDFNKNEISRRINLFNILPQDDSSVYFLFFISIISSIFVIIGLETRLACLISFFCLVTFNHRNPNVFHSGDALLRTMVFLLTFSNAKYAFSLDSYLYGYDINELRSPWCERLMQIQLSIVYLRTAELKFRTYSWRVGAASYYPLLLKSFARFYVPSFLMKSPWVEIATWGTLFSEFAGGALIWIKELRYPSMIIVISLHLVIEYCLRIQLFGWTMIASVLLFLRPYDVINVINYFTGVLFPVIL